MARVTFLSFTFLILGLVPLFQQVSAHAFLEQVVLNGQTIDRALGSGPIWFYPENGPAATSSSLDSSSLACGKDVTAATEAVEVAAGSQVGFIWGTGMHSVGPILVYMAECEIGCDPTTVSFFKIAELGLNDAGVWPVDEFVKEGQAVTATIPSDIKSGNYVLRGEVINLGSIPGELYPSCVSVFVTGGGSASPADTVNFPGAYTSGPPSFVDGSSIKSAADYTFPGPAVYAAAGGGSPNPPSNATLSSLAASASSTATSRASDVEVGTSSASATRTSATSTTASSGIPNIPSSSPNSTGGSGSTGGDDGQYHPNSSYDDGSYNPTKYGRRMQRHVRRGRRQH